MVFSPTGSLDVFLILGCMTSNLLYLSFSSFYSSSLWRTDTIVFAKLNKLPLSRKHPPNVFEMNNPGGGGRLIKDLRCVYDGVAESVTLVPVRTSVLYTTINLQYVYENTLYI